MTRQMRVWVLVPWLGLLGGVAGAQERGVGTEEEEVFGAVVAPAAMPDGASGFSGWVGVPELGAAFRQGFDGWEVGGRVRLDYLRLSVTADAQVRRQVYAEGAWAVAPELGLGVTASTGSEYFDAQNLGGWFLRIEPAVLVTWRPVETVAVLGRLEVPFDQGLSQGNTWRLKALVGGGAEFYLGENLSLSALGLLGADVFQGLLGRSQSQLGYGLRLGLGVRLF